MTAKENPIIEPSQEDSRQEPQTPPIIGVSRKEDDASQPPIPEVLPILPVRNMVVFPGTVIPLSIGRASSRQLLDESLPQSKIIGLVTQRNHEQDNPGPEDLYSVGAAALVLKLLRQSEDNLLIVIQALRRITLRKIVATQPFIRAEVEVLHSTRPLQEDKQWEATVRNLRETAGKLIELTPDAPAEAKMLLANIEDPGLLADFLASNLPIEAAQKQDLLEELDVVKRVRAVQLRLSAQLEILQLQQKIQKDVASQFSDAQRRAYLHEQIRAIQRELGEEDTGTEEQVARLRRRLQEAQPPKEVLEQAERELNRLKVIPPASPEFSVIVSYAETLADLPWAKMTPDQLDLNRAQEILDRDHYDLEKVKRRLIEY
ncbi:MAG TPA: LON peptidase substrate-binding domain-containing protein, partial [Bacillota bacterium]|nr:LON peptidase substrate-binding domain-containing protein [Bacillota bacterium]